MAYRFKLIAFLFIYLNPDSNKHLSPNLTSILSPNRFRIIFPNRNQYENHGGSGLVSSIGVRFCVYDLSLGSVLGCGLCYDWGQVRVRVRVRVRVF